MIQKYIKHKKWLKSLPVKDMTMGDILHLFKTINRIDIENRNIVLHNRHKNKKNKEE